MLKWLEHQEGIIYYDGETLNLMYEDDTEYITCPRNVGSKSVNYKESLH